MAEVCCKPKIRGFDGQSTKEMIVRKLPEGKGDAMATQKVTTIPGHERHVHAEHNGEVNNDTVHVSKSAGHQVTWTSAGKAIIAFSSHDGSPFQESIFHVPAGGSVSSGPAKVTAENEKSYKYSVVGEKGVKDPTVIIHN